MSSKINVLVTNEEQFNAVSTMSFVDRIFAGIHPVLNSEDILKRSGKKIYLALPYVLRKEYVPLVEKLVKKDIFSGFLVRTLEEFFLINDVLFGDESKELILDTHLYVVNSEALEFYIENTSLKIGGFYHSFESSKKEMSKVDDAFIEKGIMDVLPSLVVYGRIPMMISANCVKKTTGRCDKQFSFDVIKDRYNTDFPVLCDCDVCTNITYNSVPLSLHEDILKLKDKYEVRLDFTDESYEDVKSITDYFATDHGADKPPYEKFTTGHYRRGIE